MKRRHIVYVSGKKLGFIHSKYYTLSKSSFFGLFCMIKLKMALIFMDYSDPFTSKPEVGMKFVDIALITLHCIALSGVNGYPTQKIGKCQKCLINTII